MAHLQNYLKLSAASVLNDSMVYQNLLNFISIFSFFKNLKNGENGNSRNPLSSPFLAGK
jgi:hypothetical protein